MLLKEWVTVVTYALFSVLILIEIMTLIKLIKEGEQKECIKILVFYIISNTAMILNTYLNKILSEADKTTNMSKILWLMATSGLAFVIYFIC